MRTDKTDVLLSFVVVFVQVLIYGEAQESIRLVMIVE